MATQLDENEQIFDSAYKSLFTILCATLDNYEKFAGLKGRSALKNCLTSFNNSLYHGEGVKPSHFYIDFADLLEAGKPDSLSLKNYMNWLRRPIANQLMIAPIENKSKSIKISEIYNRAEKLRENVQAKLDAGLDVSDNMESELILKHLYRIFTVVAPAKDREKCQAILEDIEKTLNECEVTDETPSSASTSSTSSTNLPGGLDFGNLIKQFGEGGFDPSKMMNSLVNSGAIPPSISKLAGDIMTSAQGAKSGQEVASAAFSHLAQDPTFGPIVGQFKESMSNLSIPAPTEEQLENSMRSLSMDAGATASDASTSGAPDAPAV